MQSTILLTAPTPFSIMDKVDSFIRNHPHQRIDALTMADQEDLVSPGLEPKQHRYACIVVYSTPVLPIGN